MSYRCASVASELHAVSCGKILRSVIVLTACSCGAAFAQVPSSDYFPIGVHGQPKLSFDKWKARGINTLFQYEGENNAQGVPTAGFGQISTTTIGATTNIQTPTSRQGTVVARFTF